MSDVAWRGQPAQRSFLVDEREECFGGGRAAEFLHAEQRAAQLEEVVGGVFNVNGNLLLAHGHHRVAAAEQLGRLTVRADVREGKRSDALQFAIDFAQRQRGLSRHEVLDAIARRGQRPEGNP